MGYEWSFLIDSNNGGDNSFENNQCIKHKLTKYSEGEKLPG